MQVSEEGGKRECARANQVRCANIEDDVSGMNSDCVLSNRIAEVKEQKSSVLWRPPNMSEAGKMQ